MILDDILQDQNPWWRDGTLRRSGEYPVRRELQPRILSRILHPGDRRATLLLGPRQVGKTVLLLQLIDDLLEKGWPPPNLTYFDFSDERIIGEVSAREVVQIQPVGLDPQHPRIFLLDEIRSASKWDLWLKQAVDARVGRIVATDSAARLLRAGTQESGQGRWDEIFIEGLTFREFINLASPGAEDILRLAPILQERYLAIGGFPGRIDSPGYLFGEGFPEARRQLRADIAERAILRDLSGRGVDVDRIKDLFVYLLQDSGMEFKAESRAGDLNADPRSVREWARLLTDTLLIFPLERFARHAAAALRSRPKIFAADPGLIAAFALLPVQDPEVRGRAVEAAVFRHLREASRQLEGRLSYFRQQDDLEIDFVHEAPGVPLTGIEVTASPRVRPQKIHRFRRAGKALGAEKLAIIHGGLTESEVEEIRILPLQKFLLTPVEYLR